MSMGLFAFADYAQATNGELEINNEVISSSGKEEQLGGAHSNVDPELFLETYTKSEELHHQSVRQDKMYYQSLKCPLLSFIYLSQY